MFPRLIALIVPPVLAFLFWADILSAVPSGVARDWLPVIAAVLYGLLILSFSLKPRPGSKVAALEEMAQHNRKVMNRLADSVEAGFKALNLDVAQIRSAQERAGKSLISVEQLNALQVFDPAINTKVPQLMALADALSKIEMPDFDVRRVEGLVSLAQHMNKLVVLRQSLESVDFTTLAEVTGKAGQFFDAVQSLSLDGDGDHRDYERIQSVVNGAAGTLQAMRPMLAEMAALESGNVQVANVIERIDEVMENVGKLANDGDDDPRDYGDLLKLVGKAAETLKATAVLVHPDNGMSPTLVKDLRTVGEIVDAVESVVRDEDGHPIDFGDTTEAVESLEKLTSTVVPLMGRMRQTA